MLNGSIMSSYHRTFVHYNRLPVEVRFMILGLIQEGGVHDIFVSLTKTGGKRLGPPQYSFTSTRPVPISLQINQELRREGLKNYFVEMFKTTAEGHKKVIYVSKGPKPGTSSLLRRPTAILDLLNLVPIKGIKSENPTHIISSALKTLSPTDLSHIWRILVQAPINGQQEFYNTLASGLTTLTNLSDLILLTDSHFQIRTPTLEKYHEKRVHKAKDQVLIEGQWRDPMQNPMTVCLRKGLENAGVEEERVAELKVTCHRLGYKERPIYHPGHWM